MLFISALSLSIYIHDFHASALGSLHKSFPHVFLFFWHTIQYQQVFFCFIIFSFLEEQPPVHLEFLRFLQCILPCTENERGRSQAFPSIYTQSPQFPRQELCGSLSQQKSQGLLQQRSHLLTFCSSLPFHQSFLQLFHEQPLFWGITGADLSSRQWLWWKQTSLFSLVPAASE